MFVLKNRTDPESQRLREDADRTSNWKRWGPYLSERQWGTVREDYSHNGEAWQYFLHEHARSRTYRWGEDGLMGICDRQCRLCFSLALWNGKDYILKERLFGLAGFEGNHGEDVKECYYYLDSSPTHSYMKTLYKYPQAAFPYDRLREESRRRSRQEPEFELSDTGIFDDSRYFDVFVEYAKKGPDDILIRICVRNHGPDEADLHVLPTMWFRNVWAWGRSGEGYGPRPSIRVNKNPNASADPDKKEPSSIVAQSELLCDMYLYAEDLDGTAPKFLFTENETNRQRLYHVPNEQPYVKDAFHEAVVHGNMQAVNPAQTGTKTAAWYQMRIPPGGEKVLRLRLCDNKLDCAAHEVFNSEHFDHLVEQRRSEADLFYAQDVPQGLTDDEKLILRQANAGLLWTKQFYYYAVKEWLDGDPAQPAPPPERRKVRNKEWEHHLYNRDIISMPDKWEYPWYAAWDLAFHMIPFANLDPEFAKSQMELLLREWYMHPNGQIPAYEFNFSDVNPPIHAWAAWRVYKMTGKKGERDRRFLAHIFQKLLMNFTWWVNRKDEEGNNLFSGGFLGLDNIGVFDRSKPLPGGGRVEQADGTAWMAFYCTTMLGIALELASEDPVYEDLASKFFEHFVAIAEAINRVGGTGLWNEEEGFYYDQIHTGGQTIPLRIRSMVGIIPLFACEVLSDEHIAKLPGFKKRMQWFLDNRRDLAAHISYMNVGNDASGGQTKRLLAIPSKERLTRVLRYVLDEHEFLSPYGVRSLSRVHKNRPFELKLGDEAYRVSYVPGDSDSYLFGGNSNWRGPVWFPVNFLLVEALERYHYFYGDDFKVECPTGSGRWMNLQQVAHEIARRLGSIFVADQNGRRACHGDEARYAQDPNWRDLVLFYEYFHGDSGKGIGASHQTGWTALVTRCLGGRIR